MTGEGLERESAAPSEAEGVVAASAVLAAADDGAPPPSDRELADWPRNDYGNGRRLIARHGRDLRAVAELQRDLQDGWLCWAGTHWQGAGAWSEAQRRAHDTAGRIADEADAIEAEGAPEPRAGESGKAHEARVKAWEKRVERHHAWAVNSGNAAKTAAMLRAAAPYLQVRRRELDRAPRLLALPNGTLDLDGAEPALRPPERGDLITRAGGVPYDREATAYKFWAFLKRVLPDPDVRGFVQRYMGYALTGEVGEQLLCLFYGTGANGKSTLLNILRAVMGDYALTLPFASLVSDPFKRGSDATPDLVRLPGARLVMASEPEVGAELSEGVVKEQTGGEPIQVRPLYGQPFEFEPTHKLVLSFNNRPKIKSTDHGTWRRLALVPFEVTIPAEERDPGLERRIRGEEASGVLNWLVDGYLMWREQGLAVPEAVRASTADYRAQSDPLADFLEACTRPAGPGEPAVKAKVLYEQYDQWCKANGVEPIGQTRFGRSLPEREGVHKRKIGGLIYYTGIALRDGLDFGAGGAGADVPPPNGPEDYYGEG